MAGISNLKIKEVEQAKGRVKSYRLSDGGGMYLEVMPSGSKYWRLKYRYGGKEKRLALGVFPDIGLAEARERMRAAKVQLAEGNQHMRQSNVDCLHIPANFFHF